MKKCISVIVAVAFSIAAIEGCQSEATKAYDQGKAALDKYDLDLAISCFTEAIRIDPKHTEAYAHRALAYKCKGGLDKELLDKAIADFTEAIRLRPDYAFAYDSRGSVYKRMNENQKAESDFAEAKRLGH
jgi:tetratricopeptide (TPR) repeat protein